MQTYYQKHKTIQAFQFNGTFAQLQHELPALIWEEMVEQRTNKGAVPPLIETDANQIITKLRFGGEHWPYQKIRSNRHWIHTAQQLNDPKPKYHYQFQTLHLHDYITIKYPIVRIEFTQDTRHEPFLIIKNPRDFETHWSKQPIRLQTH